MKCQGEIEGTQKLGEKSVEDNWREKNLGDKITKVSRKEMGLNHVKGIWERKVGEVGNYKLGVKWNRGRENGR